MMRRDPSAARGHERMPGRPVWASPMIVTPSEPSLTQLALTLATRPPGAAEASAPRVVAQAAITPTATTADDVAALLQGAEDVPEARLPSSDLARRYAESGTLTARPEQAAAAGASTLASADDQLLESLGRTLRTASAAAAATPAATQQPVMTVLVDGRSVPLSAAQLAAVRAAVGPSLRRLGPGAGVSDSEDPTAHVDRARADDRPVRIVQGLAPAAGPRVATARRDAPSYGDAHRSADQAGDARKTGSTQAATSQPIPYEPVAIAEPVSDAEHLGPGPEALAATARSTAVVSGLAIAFSEGITAQDVTARLSGDHVSIAARGHSVVALAVTTPLVAQLVFADGTTSLLHLND